MPELGPLGSVRGAAGNSRPYRERDTPPTFIEPTADHLPAILNGVFVDHATGVRLFAAIRNPSNLSHTVARRRIPIHLLFDMSL